MYDRCYKIFQVVGTSSETIEDAINNALSHIDKSQGKIRWFEVDETRGHVENGKVAYYQVVMRVGRSDESKQP